MFSAPASHGRATDLAAVPPGGALLRTSVMANHETATLDRALEAFATVKRSFEAEHGPLPGAIGAGP